jgi:hypothetical protein
VDWTPTYQFALLRLGAARHELALSVADGEPKRDFPLGEAPRFFRLRLP